MNVLTFAATRAFEFLRLNPVYQVEDHTTLAEPKLRWSGPVALTELTFPAKFAKNIERAGLSESENSKILTSHSEPNNFFTTSRNLIEYATYTG